MRLPEGWSEGDVLRCAAHILDASHYDREACMARWHANELDAYQKLAASAVTDDQGEKEAGGDSVLKAREDFLNACIETKMDRSLVICDKTIDAFQALLDAIDATKQPPSSEPDQSTPPQDLKR